MTTLQHYRERLMTWAITEKMDRMEVGITRLTAAAWATLACFITKTCRMFHAINCNEQWRGRGLDRQAVDMADINMYKNRQRQPVYIQKCRKCERYPCMHYYCKHMLGRQTIEKTNYLCLLCWAKQGTVTMDSRKIMEEVIKAEIPDGEKEEKKKGGKRKELLKYFNICKTCGKRKKWLIYAAAMKVETNSYEEDIIFTLLRQVYLEVLYTDARIGTITTYRYFIKKVVTHAIGKDCGNKLNRRMARNLFQREREEKMYRWLGKSYIGLTQTTRDIFKEKEEEKEGRLSKKDCDCIEYVLSIKDMIVYV